MNLICETKFISTVICALTVDVYSWMLLNVVGRSYSSVLSWLQTHSLPSYTFTTIMNQVYLRSFSFFLADRIATEAESCRLFVCL